MQHQLLRLSFLQDKFFRPPTFRLIPLPKTPFFDSCPCLRPPFFGLYPCLRPPFFGLCPCLRPPFLDVLRHTPTSIYRESPPPPPGARYPNGSRPINIQPFTHQPRVITGSPKGNSPVLCSHNKNSEHSWTLQRYDHPRSRTEDVYGDNYTMDQYNSILLFIAHYFDRHNNVSF